VKLAVSGPRYNRGSFVFIIFGGYGELIFEGTSVLAAPAVTVATNRTTNQIAGDHPNLKDGVWFGRPPRTLGT
jgi:hypothetical protein